jgi:CheY-like chemotaxis protein
VTMSAEPAYGLDQGNCLEDELRQTQKTGSHGQPSGRIAHDFNNIFSVIIGMTELLSVAAARDPHLAMIAKTIDEAAERGAALTARMLASASHQAGQPASFERELATATEAGMTEARHGHGETILVVEDGATVRRMVARMLESLGYEVRQAEDGRSALEILKLPGKIDLLFTDLVMPYGMSGRDLFDQGRAHRPDLKVLFTSGYSQGLADPHPGPLLSKPYRKDKLASTVRALLDGMPAG